MILRAPSGWKKHSHTREVDPASHILGACRGEHRVNKNPDSKKPSNNQNLQNIFKSCKVNAIGRYSVLCSKASLRLKILRGERAGCIHMFTYMHTHTQMTVINLPSRTLGVPVLQTHCSGARGRQRGRRASLTLSYKLQSKNWHFL